MHRLSRLLPIRRAVRPVPFAYLYGARNDTEARHNNLKGRIKYMPGDILGQEFRLLGAALVMNAATWQTALHAHGEHNVIDDTV